MQKLEYIEMLVADLRMVANDLEEATGRLETIPHVRACAADIAEARDVLTAILSVLTLRPAVGSADAIERVH